MVTGGCCGSASGGGGSTAGEPARARSWALPRFSSGWWGSQGSGRRRAAGTTSEKWPGDIGGSPGSALRKLAIRSIGIAAPGAGTWFDGGNTGSVSITRGGGNLGSTAIPTL